MKRLLFILSFGVLFAGCYSAIDDVSVSSPTYHVEAALPTPNGQVSIVDGERGEYKEGDSITLKVEPDPGYILKGWDMEGQAAQPAFEGNGSYIFKVEGVEREISLRAVFEEDGDGTAAKPKKIYTHEALAAINNTLSAPYHYSLMAPINLRKTPWMPIGYSSATSNNTYPFQGVFHGNGYTISRLWVTDNSSIREAGLFGLVKDGRIEHLIVKGEVMTSTGTGSNVGLVAGRLDNASIDKVAAVGNVTVLANYPPPSFPTPLSYGIGGIAGMVGDASLPSTISNCYSDVNVAAIDAQGHGVGGIAGGLYGEIVNCVSLGDVTATKGFAGGLVGVLHSSTTYVKYSFSAGMVGTGGNELNPSYNYYAGGLVGDCGSGSGAFVGRSVALQAIVMEAQKQGRADAIGQHCLTHTNFFNEAISTHLSIYASGNTSISLVETQSDNAAFWKDNVSWGASGDNIWADNWTWVNNGTYDPDNRSTATIIGNGKDNRTIITVPKLKWMPAHF